MSTFLVIIFTAEPSRYFIYLSVCCWTFELSLLLNFWDYMFAAEPLNFLYCWTFKIICLLLNLWSFFTAEPLKGSAVNKITKKSGRFLQCGLYYKHATLTVLFLSGLRHSAVSYSFIQVGGNLGKIKTQCLNLLSLGIS